MGLRYEVITALDNGLGGVWYIQGKDVCYGLREERGSNLRVVVV